jgi:hypothetical protein
VDEVLRGEFATVCDLRHLKSNFHSSNFENRRSKLLLSLDRECLDRGKGGFGGGLRSLWPLWWYLYTYLQEQNVDTGCGQESRIALWEDFTVYTESCLVYFHKLLV